MSYIRKHDRNRPRSWFNLFLRLGGWSSLILGVLLLVFTMVSAGQIFLADRMDREGRITTAVVTDQRIDVTTDSDGDTTTDHFVTFRYKAPGGGREIEVETSRGFYDGVAPGDNVPVRYLIDDPKRLEYDIGQYRRAGGFFRWVGLAFGLMGLFLLWKFGKETNVLILARRDGEKRMARVIGILETGYKVNEQEQGRLQWREEDGQTGESLLRSTYDLSRLYQMGDEIVVFRLGDTVVWEGDVGPPRREVSG